MNLKHDGGNVREGDVKGKSDKRLRVREQQDVEYEKELMEYLDTQYKPVTEEEFSEHYPCGYKP